MKKIYGILMVMMLVSVGVELLAQASTTVQSNFDTATTAISTVPAVTANPDSLGVKVEQLTVLVKDMQHPTLWSIIALICVVISLILIVVGLFIKKPHSAAIQQILQAVTKK